MVNKTIPYVFFFTFFWTFSRAMVMFFTPIYLYSIGYSIPDLLILQLSALFTLIPVVYFTGFLVSKVGYKLPLFISIPFNIGLLFLLGSANDLTLSPIIIGLVAGLGSGFSDVTKNILYSNNTLTRTRGQEMSYIHSCIILGAFFGPILGGVILQFLSFSHLILAASLFYLLSIIPLSKAKHFKLNQPYRPLGIIKRQNFKYLTVFFLEGLFFLSIEFIYPLFLATIIGNYFHLGIYGALSPLALIIFSLLIGHSLDKRRNWLRLSGLLLAIIWLLKATTFNLTAIALLLFVGGLIEQLFILSKNKIIYDWAHQKKAYSQTFIAQEEISFLSRIIVLSIALLIPNPLIFILLATALSSLAFIFLKFFSTNKF